MLDLQIISPEEPVEPGYIVTFTDLSDSDQLFQNRFLHWSKEIEDNLLLRVVGKSMSYRVLENNSHRYAGDFYVVCRSLADTTFSVRTTIIQESVKNWRYRVSDCVFHLTRYSYRNNDHWLHFILTNSPRSFQNAKVRY